MAIRSLLPALLMLTCLAALAPGCSKAYYATWEKLGWEKRDILVDRVEDARDAQTDAKEQFTDALEQFRSVIAFDAGELDDQYDALSRELSDSQRRADAVTDRIAAVEKVADDLFAEWEQELDQYNSDDLRRRSRDQLTATRDRYDQMLAAMQRAEAKMQPVLDVFEDQVLFLKHNLNARAIASLEDVAADLDEEVAALVEDMQTSIDEANAFIDGLR
jgi:septal ring factor EnvC (AmiA/AmiB activator)